MTQSKIEIAKKYLKLIGDTTTDPEKFANENRISRIHHLIEIEDEKKISQDFKNAPKSFWSRFTSADDED